MVFSLTSRGEPMIVTWDEYTALPEDSCLEYIDGGLVVSPRPTEQHQVIAVALAGLLKEVLPGTHKVNLAWSWKPAKDEFIPDVIVYDRATAQAGSQARFTGIPALVVEILSSNRRDDLLLKMARYAAVGLPHYWIVDPRSDTLTTYAIVEDVYVPTAVYGRGDVVELDFVVARVTVEVETLFS